MLDLFGWKFDKEGPKSDSFSDRVSALGVVFDLAQDYGGFFAGSQYRKTRIEDTTQYIDEILQSRRPQQERSTDVEGSPCLL